jgi:biuret amidohydrolase
VQPPVEIRDRGEYKERMNSLLTIDPKRTVVLTVDMQREYLDVEIGGNPLAATEADRVLKHSRELLDFARASGILVVHAYTTRRPIEIQHRTGASAFGAIGRAAGLTQNAQAGVSRIPDRLEGSPQSLVPASLVAPEDIHIPTKKMMDSFLGTDLEFVLQRVARADTVVLTGVNTDTCVYCTAFGVSTRGYKPILISDCVASTRGADQHWMALELMSRTFAWVLTVDQFKEKARQGSR